MKRIESHPLSPFSVRFHAEDPVRLELTAQQPILESPAERSVGVLPVLADMSLAPETASFGDPGAAYIGIVASQADSICFQMFEDELECSRRRLGDIALTFMVFVREVAKLEFRQVPVDRSNVDLRGERSSLLFEGAQKEAVAPRPGICQIPRGHLCILRRFDVHQDVFGLISGKVLTIGLAHCVKQWTIPGMITAQVQPFCLQAGGKI